MFLFKTAKEIVDQKVLFFHDFVEREENQEKRHKPACSNDILHL